MRRTFQELHTTDRSVDVNMSPLIDVVFLLLIFFVVTTVFVEETGVEIDKPKAVSVEHLDKKSLMLALMPDGRIVYGGREISLSSVRGVVARQVATDKTTAVIILADRMSRSGQLVELLDECKLAGAQRVSVAAAEAER